MPSVCTIENCQRSRGVLCYVCEENFCREHFDKHDHSFNSLLKSFNEQTKDLNDRLDDWNTEELIEHSYEKLDQWREQSYKTIDRFYQKKCQEIQRRFQENIDRQQEKTNHLHSRITQLLEEENVTLKSINLLRTDLTDLQRGMTQLQQTVFEVEVRPFELDPHCITIEQINTTHFSFHQLSRPYRTIDCSSQFPKPLATNEQYLLTYRKKNLCLIDRQLNLIKQTSWTFGRIWDMCWAGGLNRFIIVGHYEIYFIDQDQMSIERISTIPRRNWWTCTCSARSLFLSTYEHASTIMEFSFQPSIQLIQQWTACEKEEFLKDMVYNEQKMALTIYNQKYLTKRIELRSINQLDILWSLPLDSPGECHNTLRACSINDNQWLVADFDHQRLYHITDDGRLKTIYPYHYSPWYVNFFPPNILVISTKQTLNFHKF